MTSIEEKLDQLYEMGDEPEKIKELYNKMIFDTIGQKAYDNVICLEKERDDRINELEISMKEFESEIKEEVASSGVSVSGKQLKATFVKGRVSWNGKLLDGYALAHPDILAAKSIGDPTVRIQAVK